MSVIISLSPWSTFWSMGNGGGTPLELSGVECLKKINSQVLHFVEEGLHCDAGNIPVQVHIKNINPITIRVFSHLGRIGQNYLFKLKDNKWREFNSRFFNAVISELKKRNVNSVSLIYCHTASLVDCGKKLGETFNCPVVSYFYGTFLAPIIGFRNSLWKHATEYLGWTTPVDLRICLDDGTKGLEVAKDLRLPLDKFLFQPHGLAIERLNTVTETGLTDEFFSKDTMHIMTASRLASWKRVDRLLLAIPHVVKSIPNIKFLILGDGPERAKLENLTKKLKISEWTRFVGPVPQETVFSFMRKCDVFVSTNDFSNLSEGMKQAMYLGMCVIATEVGDTHLLIKNDITGKLVPLDDEMALADSLIQVLSQNELRFRLGQSARDYILVHEPTEETINSERIEAMKSLIDSYKRNGF